MFRHYKKALLTFFVATTCFAHNILDFGAIVDEVTHEAEVANSKAIHDAIMAAATGEDRSVLIPSGLTFSSLPIHVANVTDIEVVIDGTILVSKDHKSYQPKEEKTSAVVPPRRHVCARH